jgi:hypothetical protein
VASRGRPSGAGEGRRAEPGLHPSLSGKKVVGFIARMRSISGSVENFIALVTPGIQSLKPTLLREAHVIAGANGFKLACTLQLLSVQCALCSALCTALCALHRVTQADPRLRPTLSCPHRDKAVRGRVAGTRH